jgi:3-carboxy-cis,cis-muconate cycloisomerase
MSRLIDSLATTEALEAVFSDTALLQAVLDFEVALATVQAERGVIPQAAADAIRSVAIVEHFDAAAIAREARQSGTVAVPFVKALMRQVRERDATSGGYVHWGATSQDLTDSALVLALSKSRPILTADHDRLDRSLRVLSDRHARTVMLGRTLLQPAPPITFGLKVASWVAALGQSWARLHGAYDGVLVLQFGGASGTLAALGDNGPAVASALASRLRVRESPPWHTRRDCLATFVGACGVYCGALGKVATDIALLMQHEVGEVAEPGGGSTAMPHKRNPAGCATVLAAATRTPALVSSFLTGMVQEHERGVGGWHAEWPTVTAAIKATGAAVAAMADLIDGLEVFADRMRSNIERTKGVVFAERAVTLMAPAAGKDAALEVVTAALERCRSSHVTFREALKSVPAARQWLTADQLQTIDVPEQYLGSAEAIRMALLKS